MFTLRGSKRDFTSSFLKVISFLWRCRFIFRLFRSQQELPGLITLSEKTCPPEDSRQDSEEMTGEKPHSLLQQQTVNREGEKPFMLSTKPGMKSLFLPLQERNRWKLYFCPCKRGMAAELFWWIKAKGYQQLLLPWPGALHSVTL